MTNRTTVTENDIHAYVDGVLDDRERATVEQWLKSHPDEQKRVQAYRDQNARLHELFDPVLDQPVPISLTKDLLVSGRGAVSRLWRNIAAGILLFVSGSVSGWWLNELSPGAVAVQQPMVRNAISAHSVYVSEIRHPVEVGIDQEKHLLGWLSKRLGKPVRAPGLDRLGYKLIGGRLLPDYGEPAAQFMYENQSGNRVTVYMRRNGKGQETAFKFASQSETSAFYWVDQNFAYALTGQLDRSQLLEMAQLVYQDLSQN